MQNAKDSFYVALRTRLQAINPQRTILLRSAVRPGILVEEAEAAFAQAASGSGFPLVATDVFVLRWLGLAVDMDQAVPLVAAECEVIYSTLGTQSFGGLDRGRAMTEMDLELMEMLTPFQTAKFNYASTPPQQMLTQVFWDEPVYTPMVVQRERLTRSARVMVYSYQETGE
jgi:hypothetical protein